MLFYHTVSTCFLYESYPTFLQTWTHTAWACYMFSMFALSTATVCVTTNSACLHRFDQSLTFSLTLPFFRLFNQVALVGCDSVGHVGGGCTGTGPYMFDTFSARREKCCIVQIFLKQDTAVGAPTIDTMVCSQI